MMATKDPEKKRANRKRYREKNKDKIKAKRDAKQADPVYRETRNNKQRENRHNRKNDANEKKRAWRNEKLKDPEWAARERADTKRRNSDPVKRRSRWNKWTKARPHVIKAARERRYARKHDAPGVLTASDVEALYRRTAACAYCNKLFGIDRRPTVEHMIPLSRGGTNHLSNIVLACRPCNSSKGSMTADEFREWLRNGRPSRSRKKVVASG